MIDRTHSGVQCHTRHLLRTIKGSLSRGSRGTVVSDMENLGRYVILVTRDMDFTMPVFPHGLSCTANTRTCARN